MRRIDCQNVRREIEQTTPGHLLSSLADDHLKTCVACEKFSREDNGLRQILSSLGTVEAPGDFDFRLRARLAQEKNRAVGPFAMRSFTFGFRSAAFATAFLLFGAALMFVGLRTPTQISLSPNAKNSAPAAPDARVTGIARNDGQQVAANTARQQTDVVGAKLQSTRSVAQPATKHRGAFTGAALATARNNGRRVTTRDFGSTPAQVLRARDVTAANRFPIGAAYQSLKVSLDNGRGSKRTISLPTVSFGSQRVLAQDASPLLATARGSW